MATAAFRGAAAAACATIVASAASGALFTATDPSGLGAEAEFALINPTTLEIRLRNTSTGAPAAFDSADQILTSVSFDLGAPGVQSGDPLITGEQRLSVTRPAGPTNIVELHRDAAGVWRGERDIVLREAER